MHGRSLLLAFAGFVHRRFIVLLLAAYAVAALWPGPGLWLRGASLGGLELFGASVRLSLPLVMLAALLLIAGLGVRTDQLKALGQRPLVLGAGLAASVFLPLALLFGLSLGLQFWHDPSEAQGLLVGLAVVASMPAAGSAAAWVQRADGDLPLGLGLVLGSTLLSPWTTPVALQVVSLFADRESAAVLSRLADFGVGAFLAAGVVVPSLAGVLGHAVIGERRVALARPHLKLASTLILLLLCYTNAATALPQAVAEQDWDFLAMVLAAVLALCVLTFSAGWGLARLLGAGPAQRTALVYSLGMSNNGTGLVLAATALRGYPLVLLPLIVYNLVQHLVAGAVGMVIKDQAEAVPAASVASGGRQPSVDSAPDHATLPRRADALRSPVRTGD